jgi:hypothetical protein
MVDAQSRARRWRWHRRRQFSHPRIAVRIRQSPASLLAVVEAVAQTIQIRTAVVMVGERRHVFALFGTSSQSGARIGVISMCYPAGQLMHRVSDRFVQQPPSLAEEIFSSAEPPACPAIATLSVVLAASAVALVETRRVDRQQRTSSVPGGNSIPRSLSQAQAKGLRPRRVWRTSGPGTRALRCAEAG